MAAELGYGQPMGGVAQTAFVVPNLHEAIGRWVDRHARRAVLRAAQLPRARADLSRRGIARRHHHRDGLCRAHADRADPAARQRALGLQGNHRAARLRLPPPRASPAPTSMPTASPTSRAAITRRSAPRCRPAARWSISTTAPGAQLGFLELLPVTPGMDADFHPLLGGVPRLGRHRSRALLPLITNRNPTCSQAPPTHARQLDEQFARLPDAAGVPAQPQLRDRVLRPAGAQRADAARSSRTWR